MKPESGHKDKESLFQKWMTGTANRKDEQQLEALAKEDAFLAEAWEGYRQFPEVDHPRNVTQLKAKLRKRYAPKRRQLLPMYVRIAATIAILIAAGISFWTINQQLEQPSDIAQELNIEEATPQTEEITAEKEVDQPVIEADASKNTTLPTTQDLTSISETKTLEIPKTNTLKPSTPLQKPQESLKKLKEIERNESVQKAQAKERATKDVKRTVENLKPSPKNNAEKLDTQYDDVLAGNKKETLTDSKEVAIPSVAEEDTELRRGNYFDPEAFSVLPEEKIIRGKVTDENGEPLIGASIVLEGTTTGTVTDIDGNFSLNVDVPDKQLVFSYIGYQSYALELSDQKYLDVTLSDDGVVLSEVTVSSYEPRQSEAKKQAKSSTTSVPRPKKGFEKYEKYIQKNLQYPAEAKTQKIEGKVLVRFQVHTNGTLSNFEILNKLGYGCDEEAIRLLQEGGNWKTSQTMQTTYAVQFKLD